MGHTACAGFPEPDPASRVPPSSKQLSGAYGEIRSVSFPDTEGHQHAGERSRVSEVPVIRSVVGGQAADGGKLLALFVVRRGVEPESRRPRVTFVAVRGRIA